MKNKKLLFIGVLTAFLMLAVPFAVISFDAESADADNIVNEITVNDADGLYDALVNTEGDVRIILGQDITTSDTNASSPFATIVNSGLKVLDLNEKTITDDSQRFIVLGAEGVALKIIGPGTINANRIVKTNYVNDDVLTIEGGNYNANYTAFLIYGTNNPGLNVLTITDATINAASGSSNNESDGAVWVSNKGPNKLTIERTVINSKEYGIYCGVLEEANLSDVIVDSESTALEIKSGTVNIERCYFYSSSYSVEGDINQGGPGDPVSTVIINNAYADLIEKMDMVNVIIDDATQITNDVPDSYSILVAAPDSAGIYLSWKDIDDKVKVLGSANKINLTSNKPIDSETTEIESESGEVVFDVGPAPIVTEQTLTVNLGDEYGESYAVVLPVGTEIPQGASVSISNITDSASVGAFMFEVEFDDIDTKGKEIYITLPTLGVSNPYVFFIDGDEFILMETVGEPGDTITFETTHNSTYAIISADDVLDYGYPSEESSNGIDVNIIYIVEIVLIALALIGLAAIIRRN